MKKTISIHFTPAYLLALQDTFLPYINIWDKSQADISIVKYSADKKFHFSDASTDRQNSLLYIFKLN